MTDRTVLQHDVYRARERAYNAVTVLAGVAWAALIVSLVIWGVFGRHTGVTALAVSAVAVPFISSALYGWLVHIDDKAGQP